jgi:SNF family Na+-dependent transporter
MPPALRKFALAVHLTVSVGWIGAVAAYLPFDVATVTTRDPQTLRAAYLAMELIARRIIVPLALASLLTGLVVSLGTKWGLCRHYWVLISLVLTTLATLVLLAETRTISFFAGMAANPETSGDDLRALGSTLVHSVGGTVVLLVVLVLNIYKPRGMTRYGWRKEEQRRVTQRNKQEGERQLLRP